MIIVIVLYLLDKWKLRIISWGAAVVFIIGYTIIKGGIISQEFETYRTLEQYNLTLNGEVIVSYMSGTETGKVDVIHSSDDMYSLRLNGKMNGKYKFTLQDENDHEYSFEYYFDKDNNTVLLNKIDE